MIDVNGRLHSTEKNVNVVAGANEILDDAKGKKQSVVNQETDAALNDRYTKSETYSKPQVNQMVAPQHGYVTVATYADLANISEHPAGCVYRVSNYDGTNSQVDATKYSEYSWDGTQYIHLATKSQIGEVFDISAYHATGGTLATYADLSAALDSNNGGGVPQSLQEGGMSVKYVRTSDSKYVQWRFLLSGSFTSAQFTNPDNWQGVTKEVVTGSNDVVTSGTVNKEVVPIKCKIGDTIKGVADFSSKTSAPFDFYAKTGDSVKVTLENVGLRNDSPSIRVNYSDGTSATLKYLPVNVGELNYYDFTATKDIVSIIIGLNSARSVYNVSIDNQSSINAKLAELTTNIGTLNSVVPNKLNKEAGNNLFDGVYTNGKGIDGYGNIVDLQGCWLSDKVYFNGNSKITANHCNTNWKYAIYDTNDNRLSFGSQTETTTVTNVENGAYVRFTLYPMSIRRYRIIISYGDVLIPGYYSLIGGYERKEVVITANSDENSNADFTGQTAIQDAINSITDFSGKTKYIIRCTGNFVADKLSDYVYYSGKNNWAMFWLYPYVELDGVNPDNCIIRATLPDTIPSGYTNSIYSNYQPAYIDSGCEGVKNITFITRNCRYPLHIDSGGGNSKKTIVIENCRLIHEGKYGDAIGTVGGTACGFGIAGQEHWIFKDCQFEAQENTLYVHDNRNMKEMAVAEFDNCQFRVMNRSLRGGIILNNLGNLTGVLVLVKNCRFNKYTGITYNVNSLDTNIGRVDGYARMRLIMDNDPMLFVIDVGKSLQFTASVEASSSIRVDEESSAFDVIFGYSDEAAYIDYNKFGYHQQYGYEWRDGDTGLAAVAMGFRLIDDSTHSLGARLGDCSSTNKTLTLTVNGTDVNVVFDADYTSYTNAQVLEVINAQLTGVAVASIYRTADDYYPEFNNEGFELVDDETPILVGHGLKFTGTGVRKATSADEGIDAIAVDAGIDGQHIRVIYGGMFSISPYSVKILKLASDTSRESCVFGAKLGISASQAGCFSLSAAEKVMVCGLNYSAEFIK